MTLATRGAVWEGMKSKGRTLGSWVNMDFS